MRSWEGGIQNLESARQYFCDMGCSHFHMSREYPERYDEYRALQVGDDLEAAWRLEEFFARLHELLHDLNESEELWAQHSHLTSLAAGSPEAIRALCDATPTLIRSVPPSSRILVAETLVGRGTGNHVDADSVIGLAHGIRDSSRARRVADAVPEFCNGSSAPRGGPPLEQRRESVLRKLEFLRKRLRLSQ